MESEKDVILDERYFFPRSRKPIGFNDFLGPVFLFGIGVVLAAFEVIDLSHPGRPMDAGRVVYLLAVLTVLFVFGSMIFPYAWSSVYMDERILRVTNVYLVFPVLLPLRRTFTLGPDLELRHDDAEGIVHVWQGESSASIHLSGINREKKAWILSHLHSLREGGKRARLETKHEETLFDWARVRVGPGRTNTYRLALQEGDWLAGSAEADLGLPFSIRLTGEKSPSDAFGKLSKDGGDDVLELGIDRTVEKTGEYYIHLRNTDRKQWQQVLIWLTRTHESKTSKDDFRPARLTDISTETGEDEGQRGDKRRRVKAPTAENNK